jgi:IPT/TIG domain
VISIVEFIPDHGPVGTAVRIFGSEFSSTLAENRVTFWRGPYRTGVSAIVSAATTFQIVAKVPPGAITGPITVTTPAGSATSGAAFSVTPAPVARAPRIVEFMPTVAGPATEVTITGADFDAAPTGNRVTVNEARAKVLSAAPTTLVALVPTNARSGRIAVTTPWGATSSSGVLFVAPAPYSTGDVTHTGRLIPGDQPRPVMLERPVTLAMSLLALVVFDGAIGEALTLEVTALAIGGGELAIDCPDGAPLLPRRRLTAADREVTVKLPALWQTGCYTILLAADGLRPGHAALALSRGARASAARR